jgi:hypothetical protein
MPPPSRQRMRGPVVKLSDITLRLSLVGEATITEGECLHEVKDSKAVLDSWFLKRHSDAEPTVEGELGVASFLVNYFTISEVYFLTLVAVHLCQVVHLRYTANYQT